MMWGRELLGTDVYHIANWFLMYSVLGWLVESVYMSLCNRRITNRGFVKGPFCPIYGFGALGAYFLLQPMAGKYVRLYFLGAILATLFEFLVAKLMQRLLGEVWWDYHEKPFNYQGIICLESTIAWGFYTVGLFAFLHRFIIRLSDSYSRDTGIMLARLAFVAYMIDFFIQLAKALDFSVKEQRDKVVERYRNFRARWY